MSIQTRSDYYRILADSAHQSARRARSQGRPEVAAGWDRIDQAYREIAVLLEIEPMVPPICNTSFLPRSDDTRPVRDCLPITTTGEGEPWQVAP